MHSARRASAKGFLGYKGLGERAGHLRYHGRARVLLAGWWLLVLAVVALEDAAKREVLVEVGPVQAERGDFDVIELFFGAARQARILGDGEPDLRATAHGHDDVPIPVHGCRISSELLRHRR